MTLAQENHYVLELARVLFEAMQQAAQIHGLSVPGDTLKFEEMPEKETKVFISVAQALKERVLDRAKLGDIIEREIPADKEAIDRVVAAICAEPI